MNKVIKNFIESSRIKFMWELDRWDVILSGVLKLDNKKICFFKRAYHPADAEDGKISYDDKEYNRYDVFEFSQQEVGFELMMHEDFVQYVGSHSDIVDNDPGSPNKNLHLVKPLDQHKKFYDKYSNVNQKKYEDNKYLGLFYITNKGIEN